MIAYFIFILYNLAAYQLSNGCDTLYIVEAKCGLQYRIQLETILEISKIYDFYETKVMAFMN